MKKRALCGLAMSAAAVLIAAPAAYADGGSWSGSGRSDGDRQTETEQHRDDWSRHDDHSWRSWHQRSDARQSSERPETEDHAAPPVDHHETSGAEGAHRTPTPPPSDHRSDDDHAPQQCDGRPVSDQDVQYLMGAIQADHFEIESGHLAEQRGVDPMTRELGAHLAMDHTKALQLQSMLAQRFGVEVPSTMSDAQRQQLERVANLTGLHFDKGYAESQIAAHEQSIAAASREVRDGCNPDVRGNAANTIPVLRQHLAMAQQTNAKVEARLMRDADQTKGNQCDGGPASHQDRDYLMTAIQGDHFEIDGGHLAEQRGVDPMTRELGARLVADHTKSLQDATELAQRLGVPVPSTMSEEQRHELEQVAAHKGLEFDKAYAETEISDHHQDISDASEEVHDGCNPDVRHNAAEEIPVLQQHLTLAEQTNAKVEARLVHDADQTKRDEWRRGHHRDDDHSWARTAVTHSHVGSHWPHVWRNLGSHQSRHDGGTCWSIGRES
jgi:putative membrane protein